jgi:hypothetical protein
MKIDLSNPDGQGIFEITAIQHKGQVMIAHMEGKVEGYGLVRLTHDYQHISNVGHDERAGGTVSGTAEAILDNGDVVSTPHMGTFTRNGGKMTVCFTDYVTNGDFNFVRFEVDLIGKSSNVSFWSLK